MKKIIYALACAILVTLACGTSGVVAPTLDPNTLQTIIVSTALAAQNQTQTANVLLGTPIATNTMLPTNTPLPTETLLAPVSYTYDGVSLSCTTGGGGICLGDQSFTVKLTIEPQGNVAGIFDQYTPDFPAIPLAGTKTNILGSVQDTKKDGNFMDFTGSLSGDLKTLNATLLFRGPDGPGKRVLLFSRE